MVEGLGMEVLEHGFQLLVADEVDGVSIDMGAEKSHCTASIKAVDGDFTQFEAQVGKGLCRDAEVGCEVIE